MSNTKKIIKENKLKIAVPRKTVNFVDLTGETSNTLLILGLKGATEWWCWCTKCHQISTRRKARLIAGQCRCTCSKKGFPTKHKVEFENDFIKEKVLRVYRRFTKQSKCPKSWKCKNNGLVNFLIDVGKCPGENYYIYVNDGTEKYSKDTVRWIKQTNSIKNQPDLHTIYCGILSRTKGDGTIWSEVGICKRWLDGKGHLSGFDCFLKDMGPRPTGYSIDRIDNSKGYCKSNCRWASARTQRINQRTRIHLIQHKGIDYTYEDLRLKYKISWNTVRYLIEKEGLTVLGIRDRCKKMKWGVYSNRQKPTPSKFK